jgi:hypothetical protein
MAEKKGLMPRARVGRGVGGAPNSSSGAWRCMRRRKASISAVMDFSQMGFPTVVEPRCISDRNSTKLEKAESGGGT